MHVPCVHKCYIRNHPQPSFFYEKLKFSAFPWLSYQYIYLSLLDLLMHQSFVIPAPLPPPPTYGDGQGVARLMCGAMTFWIPPQYRVNAGLVILRKYTPVKFTLIKSRTMTLSRSLQCRAFSRAVMDEKSLSPLFPVGGGGGGGAVVTNYWCITLLEIRDFSTWWYKIKLSTTESLTVFESCFL